MPFYEPMLATPWRVPFDDPGWWFEVKWDGVRVLAEVGPDSVVLRSRNGNNMTGRYPELASVRCDQTTVIDGEIVALDSSGRPSFQLLQSRMNTTPTNELIDRVPVTLMAFDILHHGEELIAAPIEERWAHLDSLALGNRVVRSSPTRGAGKALYAAVVAGGLEGVVAKKSGSPYRPGRRSPDWRKIVHRRSGRFVVVGFLPGHGARASTFASLLLGLHRDQGIVYVGAVGSGFDDASLVHIRAALDQMQIDDRPVRSDSTIDRSARWVEPVLCAVVEYREWTGDGHLRAPVFKGFAAEPATDATWEAEGP
ncbi:MAG: non-homologous end-joining DNA ligase [Acidimicrobiia bacterium]|nr:non-homologous end-joining DNA ligase [Acidimicrobiia bacterium]MDH4308014.1 non-homologous end-joining DNA ligase [Acidimicrobiia bacterium]